MLDLALRADVTESASDLVTLIDVTEALSAKDLSANRTIADDRPERRGFGAQMIERGMPRDLGGRASLDFPSEGVVYTLATPLSQRMSLAA